MGIAEEVEQRKALASATKRCKLGVEIQGMDEDDYVAINYAIDQARAEIERGVRPQDRLFSGAYITSVLVRNDIKIGDTVVKEHIGRKCACVSSQ